jgi:hypothetical protein
MDGFYFFQYIPGELDECRSDTDCAGEDVNIEAGIIEIALKQDASLLNKNKILAERKIRKGVVNQQKTENSNRYPK